MNKLVLPTAAAALALLLAACQSLPSVQTEVSPDARFAEYRTFAVLPPTPRAPRVPAGDHVRLSKPIREHLQQALQARGLAPAAEDKADVVFEIVGSVSPEVTYHPAPASIQMYRWGGWAGRYPLRYHYLNTMDTATITDKGVLSLIAYDARSKSVVWAGWLEGEYREGEKLERVTAAIDALLARLPAR